MIAFDMGLSQWVINILVVCTMSANKMPHKMLSAHPNKRTELLGMRKENENARSPFEKEM